MTKKEKNHGKEQKDKILLYPRLIFNWPNNFRNSLCLSIFKTPGTLQCPSWPLYQLKICHWHLRTCCLGRIL